MRLGGMMRSTRRIEGIRGIVTRGNSLLITVEHQDGQLQVLPCCFSKLEKWLGEKPGAYILGKLREHPMMIAVEDGVAVRLKSIDAAHRTKPIRPEARKTPKRRQPKKDASAGRYPVKKRR